ncbi:phospholipase [Jeotgalibacillus salarius]|uniref:Phospholipase n=1 Tax=Jeotgalibacillus salarius TaxID=546023 RepID=A0A4Y8LE03_9BACL|nr:phospholipase [Jeotgalibacillus salarius]TFE00546.1 phospholipase [Jeotgalibacillus salarius]
MRRKKRYKWLKFCVLPGYRWCGPGCSGPGDPINKTDAACKAHDECYRDTGNRCACDKEFIKKLSSLQSPRSKEGRHAWLILQYFRLQRIFTCLF